MCEMNEKWYDFLATESHWNENQLKQYNRELLTKFGIIRRSVNYQEALEVLKQTVDEELKSLDEKEGRLRVLRYQNCTSTQRARELIPSSTKDKADVSQRA